VIEAFPLTGAQPAREVAPGRGLDAGWKVPLPPGDPSACGLAAGKV